jgi:membrane protein implicated in regulation of membrane protease activity
MEYARNHRLLLLLVITGAIISFAECIISEFKSMAIGVGGHGDGAVLESSGFGNRAWQFFFLTLVILAFAIFIRYRIKKLEAKNSRQNE